MKSFGKFTCSNEYLDNYLVNELGTSLAEICRLMNELFDKQIKEEGCVDFALASVDGNLAVLLGMLDDMSDEVIILDAETQEKIVEFVDQNFDEIISDFSGEFECLNIYEDRKEFSYYHFIDNHGTVELELLCEEQTVTWEQWENYTETKGDSAAFFEELAFLQPQYTLPMTFVIEGLGDKKIYFIDIDNQKLLDWVVKNDGVIINDASEADIVMFPYGKNLNRTREKSKFDLLRKLIPQFKKDVIFIDYGDMIDAIREYEGWA